MQVLMTILYILLFIVCLSILIMIHEAGHLVAAKAFKVYCFEYSIGFGPKLFSKKRKKGETAFSLRAIPFGGFVSMYGEDVPVPEGLTIPPERSLDGIKKWKKAIILVAGVTMNAILALLIFFISNSCFPVVTYYANVATVAETSIFTDNSVKTGDLIVIDQLHEKADDENSAVKYYVIGHDGIVTFNDSTTATGLIALLNPALSNDKDLDWKYFLHFAVVNENNEITKAYEPDIEKNISKFDFSVKVQHLQEDKTYSEETVVYASLPTIVDGDGNYSLATTGVSITKDSVWLGGKAFGKSFVDFGESSTAIIRGLGSLFVSSEAREGVGGIIAIGFETTNILKNFGVNSFMRVWGLVSVNLAIVNLLPFPGLDGWQLLVLIIEGISKKKIPDKVKNIVSLVGLILLFGLMILLVFKDVFKYII